MDGQIVKSESSAEALVARIMARARNLYQTRQLLCAEAVLVALNKGLDGGLTDMQATALAAPFSVALGDSGYLCGALSGAVIGSGLLLGQDHAYRHRKAIRNSARELHDAFKLANGATCCRVLCKKVSHDKRAHFDQCADLTARAAEMAARQILRVRPDLITMSDRVFLSRRQSVMGGVWWRIVNLFRR